MNELKNYFQYFFPCYNSIEIKTFVIKQDNKWLNIGTKISFSKDEFKADSPNIEDHLPLKLIEVKLPITEYARIKLDISSKKLRVADTEILFPYYHESYNMNLDDAYCHFKTEAYNDAWPYFYCDYSINSSYLLGELSALFSLIEISNKPSLIQFGNESLFYILQDRIQLNNMRGGNSHLEIIFPIYVRLSDIKITEIDKIVATFECHQKIKPLLLLGKYTRDGYLSVNSFKVEFSEAKSLLGQSDLVCPISIENVKDFNISLDVRHKEIGDTIYEWKYPVRDLIIYSRVFPSPLYAAFALFMPEGEFNKIIKSPGTSREYETRLDIEDIFEKNIAHLLSAGGIPTIQLGKYEVLRAPNAKNVTCSADLLSYDAKIGTLYVISCKLKVTDKAMLDNIGHTAKEIERRLLNKYIYIKPMLIIGTLAPAIKEQGAKDGVVVIDEEALKKLIESAQIGDIDMSLFASLVEKKNKSDNDESDTNDIFTR